MTTNRHTIKDSEIVKPTQLLEKGLPLPFLEGKYQVDQGWCAVITVGGAYRETFQPGTFFLGRYHFFRDVKAIAVDMRMKTMTVSTTREFSIAQPVPVEINLDLAVEYRVIDALRVATEITTPLTSLFDRVIQAVRGSVVHTHIDEIRTQGEGIAHSTFQKLQAMQLPSILGIEVLNVLTTSIKATDAGNDALAKLQMSEFTKVQDWRVDNEIVRHTRTDLQWMMVNHPEIYAQIIAGNQEIIKEMVDKGLLDPAGFLNQAASAPSSNPIGLLSNFGFSGFQGPASLPGQAASPQNPAIPQNVPTGSGPQDIHARMRDEISYLQKLSGVKVDSKPGTDENNIPDGSYDLRINVPRNSGGKIIAYFVCPVGYPQVPPVLEVELNDESTPFQSATLRRWNAGGQYLVEIVREIKQYFG